MIRSKASPYNLSYANRRNYLHHAADVTLEDDRHFVATLPVSKDHASTSIPTRYDRRLYGGVGRLEYVLFDPLKILQ